MKSTYGFALIGLLVVLLGTACSGNAPASTSSSTAAAKSTASVPPGVYVTGIRLDPPQPKQMQDVKFTATFLNTTGAEQKYRWFVFIYKEGQDNPFGQTSTDKEVSIPTGTSDQLALNTWKLGPGQPCTNFTARAYWLDANGNKPAFNNTNGQPVVTAFTVCPP